MSEPGDDAFLGVPAAELASSIQQIVRATVPLMDAIGIEVIEAERGHVRTRLPWSPRNANHIGTAYAGALFSFLEATGGAVVLVAFDVARYIPVIVEATIRYARPVSADVDCDVVITPDETDRVHAALASDPRYRWTLNASAVDADGRTACEADLVYRFRSVG